MPQSQSLKVLLKKILFLGKKKKLQNHIRFLAKTFIKHDDVEDYQTAHFARFTRINILMTF